MLFGEKAALKDVSLDIKSGSKVAIIGPTAAGKTQLMNLLVGLLQPTAGEIKYDNHNINEYQRENLYKQSGKIIKTFNVTQSAEGDKNGLWTTVISCVVFLPWLIANNK